MKRYLLAIGFSVCSLSLVNGQDLHVGPEAGVNFSSMAITRNGVRENSNMVTGIKLGGVVDIGFTQMVSLQPGLFYTMKGYGSSTARSFNVDGLQYNQTYKARLFTNNIELPVNLQFKVPVGAGYFFAGGGPYAALVIGGQKETRDIRTLNAGSESASTKTATDHAILIGNSATDDIRPVDIGMNLNIGYLMLQGLYIRANAGFGLANMHPQGTSDNALRNFSTGITLGYLFGNKRN